MMGMIKKKLQLLIGIVSGIIIGSVVIFLMMKDLSVNRKPHYQYKESKEAKDLGLAAKIGERVVTIEELTKDIQDDLFDMQHKVYEMQIEELEKISLKEFISRDPRKTKEMSEAQFIDTFVINGQKPSDQDVENFIKERQIPTQHITDQLKKRIKQFLEVELKKKAEKSYLAEQTAKTATEIYFAEPIRPRHNIGIGNAPTKGSDKAKVTIIEFSEFQCPFCSQVAKNLKEIEAKYGDQVRFVFKHFPLSFHQHAKKAAEASMCAFEQGPDFFWKMHDELFADQSKLNEEGLIEKAKKVALDETKFKECLKLEKFAGFITSDIAQGNAAKINATPTIYINGQVVVGGQPLEVYTDIIDNELAK